MAAPITKRDVFLYFANRLDRARRRELEAATETDARVRQWFEELTPTEAEIREYPLHPKVHINDSANRNLAAITFLSVEREERAERARRLADLIRNAVGVGKDAFTDLWNMIPQDLLEDAAGTLLYRQAAPASLLGGGYSAFSAPSADVPCVAPDYKGGRVVIRQERDRVPGGQVDVVVVRRREGGNVEVFPPVRVVLALAEPSEGAPYWYADVPLKTLNRDDYKPNDDFVYCVEAASGE